MEIGVPEFCRNPLLSATGCEIWLVARLGEPWRGGRGSHRQRERTQIDDRDAPERDEQDDHQEECHLHDLWGRQDEGRLQEEGRRQEDHPKEDRHGPPGETADTSSSMGTKRERRKKIASRFLTQPFPLFSLVQREESATRSSRAGLCTFPISSHQVRETRERLRSRNTTSIDDLAADALFPLPPSRFPTTQHGSTDP